MGASGGYRPVNQLGALADTPSMLLARFGVESPSGFRAGMAGQLIQLPDGRIIRVPGNVDVGYSRPMFGGAVDANFSYGPNNQQRAMFNYRREF